MRDWQAQHVIFERQYRALLDVPGAGDRRGQRPRLCRRARDDARLRFRLCGAERALRPDRGDARHHAGRRRHADSAARRRRAPRQGDHPHRPPVRRRRGAATGASSTRLLRARGADGRGARDRRARSPTTRRSRCARRKKSIHAGLQIDLHSGLLFEIEAYNRLVPTEDRREGIRAFNEKRKPRFKGR